MKKLFTFLTMLILCIGSMWATDVLPTAVVGTYLFQATTLTAGASGHTISKDASGNVTISPNNSGSYGATSGRFNGTLVVKINVPSTTTGGLICHLAKASNNFEYAQGLYMAENRVLKTSWGTNNTTITQRTDGKTLTAGEHTIIFTTGESGAVVYIDGTSNTLADTGLKASGVSYKAIYIPAAYASYITEVYFFSSIQSSDNISTINTECSSRMHASQQSGTTAEVGSGKTLILDKAVAWTSLSGTGTVLQEVNIATTVAGNLPALTLKATAGTLKYTGKTDTEPTLNGTTLSGVILAGSKRIKVTGDITIENLAGNDQSTGNSTYAFYTTSNVSVTLKGNCDFTKKSNGADNGASYVGVNSGGTLIIANDANVKVGRLYNSTTLANNANITIGSGATLEVTTGSCYSPAITNNGTLTMGSSLNTNGLTLNEGSVINIGGNNLVGATTVSGNATLNATADLTLSQAITIDSGKTLTIDGDVTVNVTGNVTNNGTFKLKNATIEGGATRNFSSLPYSAYENCTLTLTETTAEFNTDDETINITNIPSYFTTVRLRRADRRYETLEVTNGSATFTDSNAKVSGPKCLYDFTFSAETLAERKAENSSWILNSGSRGSSNGLKYDGNYTSSNSYNEETGLLKAKSTPWRDMSGGNAWPVDYSVAVYANVPDVENGCLMAFGSSTWGGNKYLALLRGASSNEIKLVKGNGMNSAFEVIATMSAENATVAKHLVVFTKNGSTFKVYCDGVNVATTTYDQTLGTGFQIGSVHGGVDGTGIIRINDNSVSSEVKDAVEIQAIRIFEGILTDEQMSALQAEFPYVSKGGSYSRTISADANLGEDGAWTHGETTAHIPTPVVEDAATYYPDVTITTSATATLTVNEDATFGKTSFGGSGTLTIDTDEDGHSIEIGGAVIINSDVVVKFGAMDMSTSPITKGANAILTFDFSDFDFNKVYTTTKYQMTGLIDQDDTHITATGLPSDDNNRTYAFGYDDNHYWLTVTVRATQDVYLPSSATEITDDMPIKLTNDAATNNGLLIQGDNLIINNTGTILFKETSGFCTFEVKDGATVTVNNKTNSDYALNGETITITNGTLKLNNGNGDAKINSATINVSENGTLDNYGWLTVDGTLTVNSNFDKTILNNSGAENPSQTRGTGKIVKGGTGTITMRAMPHCTENEVTTKHPIEITGGVLILSDGAKADAITGSGTLNVPAATSISVASIATGTTLTGNGNVTTTTFPTTTPTTTDWRGTVELAAGGDVGNLTTIFNAWGNANSVIKLNSVTGWFESDITVYPTLNILSGATVDINNGYSNKEPKLTKLTGAGILQQTWNPTGTTNHKLHIATLTGFTGTLKGTHQPIVVDRIVLNRKPAVGDLLIKTSDDVTLTSLVVGWQPLSAYSWATETHDEVAGIYVTAKDDVAEKRDLANAIVLQYDGYIGEGVNKYTVSLGEDKYTSMESYNDAINAWTTVDDYVTPSVTFNLPTSAFYRIKAGDKYLQDARKSDSATQRTLTDTEGAGTAIGTLFYLNDNTFIGYQTGYGFGFSVCQTQNTEQLNSMLFTESSELGKYTIQSQQGTCESASYNEGYWGVNGTELARVNDAASGACWTLEPATEIPVTFKAAALGYATFCSPMPVKIPSGVDAYVSRISDNTISLFKIENIKDDGDNVVIPANTAVMLHKDGVTVDTPVSFEISDYSGEGVTDNGFYGTIAAESMKAGDSYYSLRVWKVNDEPSKVGFAAKSSGNLAGFKGWIWEEGTTARNFAIVVDGDLDPTGIVEALGLENENVEIYDLNGRKLSSYKKGINIVNGKKVIVQ